MQQMKRLRIYLGEGDKYKGEPLYLAVIELCKERGIRGATAARGIAGYGLHNQIHRDKVLRLSGDLPVIVEVLDSEEKLLNLLPELQEMAGEALLSFEAVEVMGRS